MAVPGTDVASATPGATTSGFTLPSNARPSEEKPATWPRVVFVSSCAAPTAMPTSMPARSAASNSTAAAAGTTTTGARSSSATRREPGGSASPYRITAAAPARDAEAASPCGSAPTGATTARPATMLKPFRSKKSTLDVPARPRVERGVATDSVIARAGATAPSRGTRWSKITSSPRRSTTRTRGTDDRASVAPTASAPAPPAGPAIEPNDGPAPPSLPAGATTSVFRSSAPCTARASGLSVKAAYGSATPTRATRTAS